MTTHFSLPPIIDETTPTTGGEPKGWRAALEPYTATSFTQAFILSTPNPSSTSITYNFGEQRTFDGWAVWADSGGTGTITFADGESGYTFFDETGPTLSGALAYKFSAPTSINSLTITLTVGSTIRWLWIGNWLTLPDNPIQPGNVISPDHAETYSIDQAQNSAGQALGATVRRAPAIWRCSMSNLTRAAADSFEPVRLQLAQAKPVFISLNGEQSAGQFTEFGLATAAGQIQPPAIASPNHYNIDLGLQWIPKP